MKVADHGTDNLDHSTDPLRRSDRSSTELVNEVRHAFDKHMDPDNEKEPGRYAPDLYRCVETIWSARIHGCR